MKKGTEIYQNSLVKSKKSVPFGTPGIFLLTYYFYSLKTELEEKRSEVIAMCAKTTQKAVQALGQLVSLN